ncbi:hypothetical protein PYW07_013429 [Mythimna separata]|uniref:BED-type domain-containing protein n=1 Tax=Mythimna separata TaxID=271217 RepID=A0AAD7Y6R9_MYTSE|nr:hypothetical protein PYW07_013429 [Mythimna separata]
MRQFNELLWKYFVPSENRIAECKQCDKELSYKSTTHNLVMHLKTKHLESYFEFNISNQKLRGGKAQRSNLPKVSNFLIWNYFKENPDKVADCRLCEKKLSYKTTIHNLKQHLKVRHSDSYKEFAEQADVVADSPEDHYSSESAKQVFGPFSRRKTNISVLQPATLASKSIITKLLRVT